MATKGKSHMNCCVVGCTEQHKSLHFLPSKGTRRTAWLQFIFDGHVPATIGKSLWCVRTFRQTASKTSDSSLHGRTTVAIKLRLRDVSLPTIRGKSADEGDVSPFK